MAPLPRRHYESPSARRGKVYLLWSRCNRQVKVGRTTGDIRVRLLDARRKIGPDVSCVYWWDASELTEREAHSAMWKYHIYGDWFHPRGLCSLRPLFMGLPSLQRWQEA